MKNAPLSALVAMALAVAAGSTVLSADRIKLRSGKLVDGSFLSADVKIIRLLMANGTIAEFPLDDVAALELTPRKSPPPPAPDPSRAPSPVTLPAGTWTSEAAIAPAMPSGKSPLPPHRPRRADVRCSPWSS